MKTIEQEIRERLAAEQLSPENVNACFQHIKEHITVDPAIDTEDWDTDVEDFQPLWLESLWKDAWNSAFNWLVAQLTAPVTKEGE